MANFKYDNKYRDFARKNRKNQTKAEKELWDKIRKKSIQNTRFLRQFPDRGIIYDFFAPSINLAIEVDGEYHKRERIKDFDKAKDNTSRERNITVIRFTNKDIINNIDQVIKEIEQTIKKLKT